jgi:glycosyltransferase involved in cell wall biosynthesis
LDHPKYSIVLPAFNESARIASTLKQILAHASEEHWNVEVVVVNDGSSDDTATIVEAFAQNHPCLRLIQNPGNRGKGFSVRNGMLHANGEVLLFSDADLSSPIAEADKLFAAIAAGADIAIGSRWVRTELQVRRQPLYRQILGRIFNLALRVVLRLNYKDTQCGFKAFTRQAAREIFPHQQIERWGFDPELLYLARKHNLKVAEVPVAWAHREGTRLHPIRDGLRMFADVLRVRRNAMQGKYTRAKVVSEPL